MKQKVSIPTDTKETLKSYDKITTLMKIYNRYVLLDVLERICRPLECDSNEIVEINCQIEGEDNKKYFFCLVAVVEWILANSSKSVFKIVFANDIRPNAKSARVLYFQQRTQIPMKFINKILLQYS